LLTDNVSVDDQIKQFVTNEERQAFNLPLLIVYVTSGDGPVNLIVVVGRLVGFHTSSPGHL